MECCFQSRLPECNWKTIRGARSLQRSQSVHQHQSVLQQSQSDTSTNQCCSGPNQYTSTNQCCSGPNQYTSTNQCCSSPNQYTSTNQCCSGYHQPTGLLIQTSYSWMWRSLDSHSSYAISVQPGFPWPAVTLAPHFYLLSCL